LAEERTGHTYDMLNLWSKKEGDGCPALGGERFDRKPFTYGNGRTVRFYSEEQIERLAKAELKLVPKVPGYVSRKVAEAQGVSRHTQKKLRNEGQLDAINVNGLAKDKRGRIRKCTWIQVSTRDLESARRRPRAVAVPASKITVKETAALLGIVEDYVLPYARKKGLKIHETDLLRDGSRSAAKCAYVRKGHLLDRNEVERERTRREQPMRQAGKPFELAGFTWQPAKTVRQELDCHPSSLIIFRDSTCHLLDGRKDGKRVPDVAVKRRPILAIKVPVTKGVGRGSRWDEAWFYCGVDVDQAKANKERNLSPEETVKRASNTLGQVKAALAGRHIVTNFAGLTCDTSETKRRTSGRSLPSDARPPVRVGVTLGSLDDFVWVNRLKKPPLSAAKYRVVRALVDAGAPGLSKGQLDDRSGCTDARKHLKELAAGDPDWKAVIIFPGKSWGRYRILSPL
jgi:hypothetical protein